MTKEVGQEKNIHFQFQETKMELNTVQDWLYQRTEYTNWQWPVWQQYTTVNF